MPVNISKTQSMMCGIYQCVCSGLCKLPVKEIIGYRSENYHEGKAYLAPQTSVLLLKGHSILYRFEIQIVTFALGCQPDF